MAQTNYVLIVFDYNKNDRLPRRKSLADTHLSTKDNACFFNFKLTYAILGLGM